jgi:signal transduction histidine kinase
VKLPIRDQILWPLMGLLLVTVAANAIFSAWWMSRRTLRALESRQRQILGVLEESSFPLSAGVMEKLQRLTGDEFLVWDTVEKRSLVGTIPVDQSFQIDPDVTESADEGQAHRQVIGERTYVVKSGRIRGTPSHRLLVFTSDETLRQASTEAIWPPLAVGMATIFASVPLTILLASGWASRIRSVEGHVQSIERGEFGRELATGGIDDEVARLVGSVNSMSRQLKAMREELVRGERSRLIAQLAAGFAHQLRNGLAGAKLAIQLHQSRCASASDRSLGVSFQQLALVEEEVRGLLSLGKNTSQQASNLDVEPIISTVQSLVSPACEHQGVQLAVSCDNNVPAIRGFAEGIRAGILNLTLNAIEAAGPGGHVWLSVQENDNEVVVHVEDDGAGPPPELADSLFDLFVTSKQEGIGLGLAVATTVAREHGGSLTWRRIGNRTRFEFRLPIEPPLQESPVS